MSKRMRKNLSRWRVICIRGSRAETICIVPAADADSAIKVAIKDFQITDRERQRRLAALPAG